MRFQLSYRADGGDGRRASLHHTRRIAFDSSSIYCIELRDDLDQLVLRAIIPERARILAQSPDSLRLEWERFKERWQK